MLKISKFIDNSFKEDIMRKMNSALPQPTLAKTTCVHAKRNLFKG